MINDCRVPVLSSAIDFLFELEPRPTLRGVMTSDLGLRTQDLRFLRRQKIAPRPEVNARSESKSTKFFAIISISCEANGRGGTPCRPARRGMIVRETDKENVECKM